MRHVQHNTLSTIVVSFGQKIKLRTLGFTDGMQRAANELQQWALGASARLDLQLQYVFLTTYICPFMYSVLLWSCTQPWVSIAW
jgi:hypothetical protein